MEEFKDRLKEVRKSMSEKMTQADFGEMLGYKRDAYKRYESGYIKEVPESFIKLVAAKTGVSESWLRTGAGAMRVSDDEAAIERLRAERNWTKAQCDMGRLLLHMIEADARVCMDALERTCGAFAEALHRELSPRAPTAEELARAEILREEREAVEKARREAEAKLAALKAGGKTTEPPQRQQPGPVVVTSGTPETNIAVMPLPLRQPSSSSTSTEP